MARRGEEGRQDGEEKREGGREEEGREQGEDSRREVEGRLGGRRRGGEGVDFPQVLHFYLMHRSGVCVFRGQQAAQLPK